VRPGQPAETKIFYPDKRIERRVSKQTGKEIAWSGLLGTLKQILSDRLASFAWEG